MSLLLVFGQTAPVLANPTGGSVAAGSVTITSAGNTLTINQSTAAAIINWQQFSISGGQLTKFLVPGSTSATLNRVLGGNPSLIYGTLQSNGIVYLINPSGIVVGPSGRIDTAGFIGSTLDITDDEFLQGGSLNFVGGSNAGIVNKGVINASSGDVYLIAAQVTNNGTINAPQGNVGLGAGSNILYQPVGQQHLFIQSNPTGTTKAVGVTNTGTIRAATAELRAAGGNAYALAINNTGSIAATGYKNINGQVYLTSAGGSISNSGKVAAQNSDGSGGTIDVDGSGATSGTVTNSGTLNASATAAGKQGGSVTLLDSNGTTSHTGQILAEGGTGGAGGNAEISGDSVQFTGTVNLTAPDGSTGDLLLDPVALTVATLDVLTGGGTNLNASTVDPDAVVLALDTANVTLRAQNNITVSDPITWVSTNTLTLNTTVSSSTIDLDAPILGVNGGLTIDAAGAADQITTGAAGSVQVASFILENGYWNQNSATLPAFTASQDFELLGGSTFLRAEGGTGLSTSSPYRITDIYGLQGLGSPSGSLLDADAELVNDIDASGTATWNGGNGFVPIGPDTAAYSGTFNGQNFTVDNLTIDTPSANYVGLFGYLSGATAENLGLTNVQISGSDYVGSLVGFGVDSSISNTYATGSVSGASYMGGLAGLNDGGTINTSYTTTTVSGVGSVGGLVGYNDFASTVENSYATGTVNGSAADVGGLVGYNNGTVNTTYATGAVGGNQSVGGLVGYSDTAGTVESSHASGAVTGDGGSTAVGGLVGENFGLVNTTYASGAVTGDFQVGGLAGYNKGTVEASDATGAVNGSQYVGGLVGKGDTGSTVQTSYATGTVTGGTSSEYVGGLVGINNSGTVETSDATGAVTGGASSEYIGGLVGYNNGGTVNTTYATGTVSGNNNLGGLVGANNGLVEASDATGTVTGGTSSEYIGGLVGSNDSSGSVQTSYATGAVTGGAMSEYVGGLVGINNSGTVKTSYATGVVMGNSSSEYVGGLVGYNNGGTLNMTYATGAVTGGSGSQNVGGLVGYNYSGSLVESSYASGAVNGNTFVGGLVGYNIGAVQSSYATAAVNGSTDVGGLVGYNDTAGTINDTYSSGLVNNGTAGGTVGGLAGYNNGSITASFWDTVTSGLSVGLGETGGGSSVANVYGLTTADLLNKSTYEGQNSSTAGAVVIQNSNGSTTSEVADSSITFVSDWTIGTSTDPATNTWVILDGQTRPMLAMEYSTTITNAHQLQLMDLDLSANYTLANNIDLTGDMNASDVWGTSTLNGGAGFVPIGNNSSRYTGTFNGAGYAINGLYIDTPAASYLGLFGEIDPAATVENVGLTNIDISGFSQVGGLVGDNNGGAISSAYTTGQLGIAGGGSFNAGGLVGGNLGTINIAYSTVTVSGDTNNSFNVGGLAGQNNGTISDAYSMGAVSGNSSVGGLVGQNFPGGTISATYSTGAVSGNFNIGGLVGDNDSGGSVQTSYWAQDPSVGLNAGLSGVGSAGNNTGATPETLAAMVQQNTFLPTGTGVPDWDFTNTWTTHSDSNTPQLKGLPATLVPAFGPIDIVDGTTPTSGVTVDLIVDGTEINSTSAISGAFTFDVSYSYLTGGILLTDATDSGNTFYENSTLSNSTATTITGVSILSNTLLVQADQATNEALGRAAGSLTANGINYTVSGANLFTNSGVAMSIQSNYAQDGVGSTYTLKGNITASGALTTAANTTLAGATAATLTGSSVTMDGTLALTGALTVDATSGDIDLNYVGLSGSPATAAGITLNATGAVVLNNSHFATGGGDFTAIGYGDAANQSGVSLFNSSIDSQGGSINLTGTADYVYNNEGGNQAGTGVVVDDSVLENASSTETSITGGNITIVGTASPEISGSPAQVVNGITGVEFYSSQASVWNGTVAITGEVLGGTADGTSSYGANVTGIFVGGTSTIRASGNGGTVDLTGNASGGNSVVSGANFSFSDGIEIGGAYTANTGSTVSVGTGGTIIITGTGASIDASGYTNGTGPSTLGAIIDDASQVSGGADSTILVYGLENSGTTALDADVSGVEINQGAQVFVSGSGGAILVYGNVKGTTLTASPSDNYSQGVEISGNGTSSPSVYVGAGGSITLTGFSATIDASNAGTSNGNECYTTGVSIDSGALVSADDGASTITITGTGGAVTTTTANTAGSQGVGIDSSSISMTSGGTLSITGYGGAVNAGNGANAGDAEADGVDFGADNGSSLVSVDGSGSITVTGYGGALNTVNADPITTDNSPGATGVGVGDGAEIEATGTTSITLMGIGGNVTAGTSAAGEAIGVDVGNSGHGSILSTIVSSVSGAIQITGYAGETPTIGIGAVVNGFNGGSGLVESTYGNIAITGTGGPGYTGIGVASGDSVPNDGVGLVDDATVEAGGAINFTGNGGANSFGVSISETGDTVIDPNPSGALPTVTAGGTFTATALDDTGIYLNQAQVTAANVALGTETTPGVISTITSGTLQIGDSTITLTGGSVGALTAYGTGTIGSSSSGSFFLDGGIDIFNGSTINSQGGNISLTGEAGYIDDTPLSGNIASHGVSINDSTVETADSAQQATITTGSLTITGDASLGITVQNSLHAVEIADSTLTVVNGKIAINGTVNSGTAEATTLASNAGFGEDGVQGVDIGDSSALATTLIQATGSGGSIAIVGNVAGSTSDGTDTTSDNHDSDGVDIEATDTTITSAGNGAAFVNGLTTYDGIYIQGTAGYIINNTSGANGNAGADGLRIAGGALVQGTASAAITLVGQGGSNTTSPSGTVTGSAAGIVIQSNGNSSSPDNGNTKVTTVNGALSITGTGGSSPDKGVGVGVLGKNGALVTVGGNTMLGTITINGTGGSDNTAGTTTFGVNNLNLPNDGVVIGGHALLRTAATGGIGITGAGLGTNGAAILITQMAGTNAPVLTASGGPLTLTTSATGAGDIILDNSTVPGSPLITAAGANFNTQGKGAVVIDDESILLTGTFTANGTALGTVQGTTADGIDVANSTINTQGANISLTGQTTFDAATSAAGTGISLDVATLETVGAGTITVMGTGGIGSANAITSGDLEGVDIDGGAFSTVNGAISITGKVNSGTAGDGSVLGVVIFDGTQLTATAGSVTILGDTSSSTATATSSASVYEDAGSVGVQIDSIGDAAPVITAGGGTGIMITGTAGYLETGSLTTPRPDANGINLQNGVTLTANNSAGITLLGTGGDNVDTSSSPLGVAYGIEISGNNPLGSSTPEQISITSGGGAISITGTAGISPNGAVGVSIEGGNETNVSIGSSSGNILVMGSMPVTANSSNYLAGISMDADSGGVQGTALIQTATGTITLNGTVANGAATGDPTVEQGYGFIAGVGIEEGASLNVTGAGAVSITGSTSGSTALQGSLGVDLGTLQQNGGTGGSITVAGGTTGIDITGTGGTVSNSSFASNIQSPETDGIRLGGGFDITAQGSAPITLMGTGGAEKNTGYTPGPSYNGAPKSEGISLGDTGSGVNNMVSSVSGAISFTGIGGSSLTDVEGIAIDSDSGGSSSVVSTYGNITFTGTVPNQVASLLNPTAFASDSLSGIDLSGDPSTSVYSTVKAQNGSVTLTGTVSSGTTDEEGGIVMSDGSQVIAQGANGAVNLTGTITNSSALSLSGGVFIDGSGGLASASGGTGLTIIGTGGAINGTTGATIDDGTVSLDPTSAGIAVIDGAGLETTGSAAITLTGTGGRNTNSDATSGSYGVVFFSPLSGQTSGINFQGAFSGTGPVAITGTAGSSASAGIGVLLGGPSNLGAVSVISGGALTITGTGGTGNTGGALPNAGIYDALSTGTFTSVATDANNGNLTFIGTSGGASATTPGIDFVGNFPQIATTGTFSLTSYAGPVDYSGTGTASIMTVSAPLGTASIIDNIGALTLSLAGGDFTVQQVAATDWFSVATNSLTIQAGGNNVDEDPSGSITTSLLSITNAAAVTLANPANAIDALGNIQFTGATSIVTDPGLVLTGLVSGNAPLTLAATGGNITFDPAGQIQDSGSGNNVVIAAGTDLANSRYIINDSTVGGDSVNAIVVTGGAAFDLYSADPTYDSLGNITVSPANVLYGQSYPATTLPSGNAELFFAADGAVGPNAPGGAPPAPVPTPVPIPVPTPEPPPGLIPQPVPPTVPTSPIVGGNPPTTEIPAGGDNGTGNGTSNQTDNNGGQLANSSGGSGSVSGGDTVQLNDGQLNNATNPAAASELNEALSPAVFGNLTDALQDTDGLDAGTGPGGNDNGNDTDHKNKNQNAEEQDVTVGGVVELGGGTVQNVPPDQVPQPLKDALNSNALQGVPTQAGH